MTREEAIKKLADIIFDVSELGDIPYDTEDEQCAMNIAKRRIGELFPPFPDNLDEAAEEYAYNNWEDNDYHTGASEGLPFDAIGHTEKCFKAGAEWMVKQTKQEQQDVDLEKEIIFYHNEHFSPCESGVLFSERTGRELDYSDYEDIAQHFAEWGASHFNARKEE